MHFFVFMCKVDCEVQLGVPPASESLTMSNRLWGALAFDL
jgi:hypothetical protein